MRKLNIFLTIMIIPTLLQAGLKKPYKIKGLTYNDGYSEIFKYIDYNFDEIIKNAQDKNLYISSATYSKTSSSTTYSSTSSTATYSNTSGTATYSNNSNLLDGQDSLYFAIRSDVASSTATFETNKLDKSSASVTYLYKTEKATDSDKLDGYNYDYFLSTSGKADDSDKLDGQDSSYYLDTSGSTQTKTGGFNIGGFVGIGKTNPGTKLDIAGVPVGYYGFRVTANNTASQSYGASFVGGTNTDDISFKISNVGGTDYFLVRGDGYITIGSAGVGDVWIGNNCSALSFTDRTPYPKTKDEAYRSVLSMVGDEKGNLDHKKLDKFVLHIATKTYEHYNKITKSTDTIKEIEYGRNISTTISAQNMVIQDLIQRINQLEQKK